MILIFNEKYFYGEINNIVVNKQISVILLFNDKNLHEVIINTMQTDINDSYFQLKFTFNF